MRLRFLFEISVAAGLLAVATVGFFWQILLTDSAWMPAGGGDLAPFLYPNYRFAAESLRQGVLPLWNPHLYSGSPFAADIQAGLFYPINLMVFFAVPTLTYAWMQYLAVFHFWLAGVLMYLCLRQLQPEPLSPVPAFAGAVAFAFSDLFVVHFGNLNMIAVAAWLPLVFVLFQRSLTASPGWAAASGAVLAVATLAGHIQITLFILLTLGLYTVWHTAAPLILGDAPWRPGGTVTAFLKLGLMLLVMIGLSAVVLFPAYEMSQYTPRAELPYAEAARYSLHPAQMVGLLVPDFFGRDPALHWGPWERVETGYIGIITLLLAIIGALFHQSRLRGFLAGLGVIAVLLALGGYSLVHGWLYALVPGFDQLRAPARFILLLDFSLAILAAMGLEVLLRTAIDQRIGKLLYVFNWSLGGLIIMAAPLSYYAMLITQDRNPAIFNRATAAASGVATFALFSIAALVALNLVYTKWLSPRMGGAVIVLVLFFDLFTLGAYVDVGTEYPLRGFDHPAALEFLRDDPGFFRVEVTTDVWHVWQPNTALVHGLYDVWGLYNPLTLADTTLFWSGAPPRSTGRYNFLGIKYIIASKAGAPADGNIVPVFEGDPDVNIYLNLAAQVPVSLVGQAEVVASQEAAWEAVRRAEFDPAAMVILESGEPLSTTPTSTLGLWEYGLNTVTVQVEADAAGYLVLADAYYPGWTATVDGVAVPIHRANYAFRAVYVPAGEHIVRFEFVPHLWWLGAGVSLGTLAALMLWAAVAWLRQRKNQPPENLTL